MQATAVENSNNERSTVIGVIVFAPHLRYNSLKLHTVEWLKQTVPSVSSGSFTTAPEGKRKSTLEQLVTSRHAILQFKLLGLYMYSG